MKCDFCDESLGDRLWVAFEAEDFIHRTTGPKIKFISRAQWIACLTCAAFIRDEDWPHLLDRACQGFMRMYPQLDCVWLLKELTALHQEFRQSRPQVKEKK